MAPWPGQRHSGTGGRLVRIVGVGYVRLLQMVVMPLIIVSIMSAIIHVKAKAGWAR